MSEENPVVDGNEPLVEDIGTTENEANAEETEKSEVESEGNAEPKPEDIDEAEKSSNVPVEKQGDISKGAQKRINTLTRQKHEYQANIKNLDNLLEALSRKLSNDGFVKNAPKEVIQKEKSKFKELQDRQVRLKENLQVLTRL